MLEMDAIKSETWTPRLSKLCSLGLSQRLSTAILYSARFSVFPDPPSTLEVTTAQAFVLALFRSFLIGDAPTVLSLLPLVPRLPQLQSSSIAVWFREDFSFRRQDVTRALSWLAHFVKREGPVIPLNILLVFSSLEEKYQVFSYFKESGDTVGQEMLIYLNPLMSKSAQAPIQGVKVHRPEMVSKGTQTSVIKERIISIPLTASISKDIPVVYAAYQNIESIQTETIFEEPENFNEVPAKNSTLSQQPLTFLVQSEGPEHTTQLHRPILLKVRSQSKDGRRLERPRSLQPNEFLTADLRSSTNSIPEVVVRPPNQERRRSSDRPRSLQPDEVYLIEDAQKYATMSRIRPSSSIEAFSVETDGNIGTMFRARSSSTLETSKKNSLKRNAAAAKAEATKRLMKAAERGDVAAAVAAIADGANVDQRDSVRRTPLHLAVVGGHEELLRRLLLAGAGRDRKDSMGRTPLHYTALRDRIGCAQLLIEAGADPNPRDSSGLTPTALASMKHHTGVAQVLKRKGGQDCSIS